MALEDYNPKKLSKEIEFDLQHQAHRKNIEKIYKELRNIIGSRIIRDVEQETGFSSTIYLNDEGEFEIE